MVRRADSRVLYYTLYNKYFNDVYRSIKCHKSEGSPMYNNPYIVKYNKLSILLKIYDHYKSEFNISHKINNI